MTKPQPSLTTGGEISDEQLASILAAATERRGASSAIDMDYLTIMLVNELQRHRSLLREEVGEGSLAMTPASSTASTGRPSVEALKKAVMRYAAYHKRSMEFSDDDETPLLTRVCQQRDGLLLAVMSLDAVKIEAALRDTDIVGSQASDNSGGSMPKSSSLNIPPEEGE